ncbi:hypothetical protein CC86DRAFT_414079 [Ophiobolus disseminans]|uniref:Uncharacterized protein n=1 Tax=Ophiobolus disseminans TaxID=1469910 RepID=A0A6A6ZBW1_9PLEO|nr:hypothetical protein CC86DRAFT_414079 [Ophiobolus disseminans]
MQHPMPALQQQELLVLYEDLPLLSPGEQQQQQRNLQPVKLQTFFRERRYVRYFIVQEEDKQQQGDEQHGLEPQGGYQQRLALLSSTLEALKHEDSEAIDHMPEKASAKDRTGCDDEPALRQVVLAVEEAVEQAVRGLGTLSIETLRWLRSAKPNEPDVRPLGQMQNKKEVDEVDKADEADKADVAEEEEEEEPQQRWHQKKPLLRALEYGCPIFARPTLKGASAPHTSATAVTAAANTHPPPCSATLVDMSDDAINRMSSLADILHYLNLLILEASLRSQ